jgi:hypothetical protein
MRATAAAVSAVSVAAPFSTSMPSSVSPNPAAECVAVERFRWWEREERMRQQTLDHRFIDSAACGNAAVGIERRAGAQPQKIVEQSVARPGVASDQVLAVDIRRVGNAAQIEHRDR